MVFLLYLTALAVLQQRGPTVALRRSYSLRGLTVRRTVCYEITKTVPNFSVFCLLSIVFRLLSIVLCPLCPNPIRTILLRIAGG